MEKKGDHKSKHVPEKKPNLISILTHPTVGIPKTIGQKAADQLTKGAGSWTFILVFIVILVLWMLANIYAWVNAWDPYPFILLNLVLSCVAALQAPIILMSQNRAGQRDRQRSEYDYAVNRKAEREIQEMKKQLTRIENRFLK
jgi:uncharacterized membrane protein